MGITTPSDLETFKGLKSKDNKAYEIIYKFYYPSVKNFITKNSGCEEDAQDIFQETILVLLEKVPKKDFNLTSSLKTYIFAISSNLWLKRLIACNKMVKTEPDVYEKYLSDYEAAETEVSHANTNRIVKVFKIMTNKCITLLKAIFMMRKILIPSPKNMVTPINTMPKTKNTNVWSRQEKGQLI